MPDLCVFVRSNERDLENDSSAQDPFFKTIIVRGEWVRRPKKYVDL